MRISSVCLIHAWLDSNFGTAKGRARIELGGEKWKGAGLTNRGKPGQKYRMLQTGNMQKGNANTDQTGSTQRTLAGVLGPARRQLTVWPQCHRVCFSFAMKSLM